MLSVYFMLTSKRHVNVDLRKTKHAIDAGERFVKAALRKISIKPFSSGKLQE